MALLAESLVEEWFNRRGYFTIRGVKEGVEEMDILAVRVSNGLAEGIHAEVQVSFRPVGYISKPTRRLREGSDGSSSSAKKRSPAEVEECAKAWFAGKFCAHAKVALRERLWPGMSWKFKFIHGVVRESMELDVISQCGADCVDFADLLTDLTAGSSRFSASAGGDLAEIVAYQRSRRASTNPHGK